MNALDHFLLPIPIPAPPTGDSSPASSSVQDALPPLLLLADDEPRNLQLLRYALAALGCRIITAANGRIALDSIRAHRPDLVILDVMMPEMDGFEVAFRLRSEPDIARTPIIFLTALGHPQETVKGFRAGAVDYIAKPFHSEELQARVRIHLELRRARELLEASNVALRASEERYRAVIEEQHDAIVRYTPEGVVTFANHIELAATQRTRNSWVGANWIITIPPADQEIVRAKIASLTPENHSFEEIRTKEEPVGSAPMTRHWINRGIFDSDGKLLEIQSVGRNITPIVRAQEALHEMNENQRRFFGIIAHDLRSPFNSLRIFPDLLANLPEMFSREQVVEVATALGEEVEKVYLFLEELLEWAMSGTGAMPLQPAPMELRDTLDLLFSAARPMANRKGVRLINQIPAGITISADTKMIHTVLRNLISNAVKFTRSDDTVTATAARLPESRSVHLTLRDTGVGMPPEKIARLFRPGERLSTTGTARERGAGLGLILCNEFIRRHSGSICVESTPGKGSSFHITLPEEVKAEG